MRYSILGFNQEKLMQTDLDLTDIVILQYIEQACGSTRMQHKLDSNGNPQVWVYHKKLMEDLPILRIAEGTLKNRLSALNQKGYVRSTVVASENGRGSRTYYGLTEMTMSLIYDEENMTTSQNNDVVTRPRHSSVTSDSKLINDSKLDKISNNKLLDIENPLKKPKQNLYQKCYSNVEEFTEDEEVRNVLGTYLKMRLEIKDKPLYANQWKGMLNKLRELTESKSEVIQIIQQSIDRGYLSFFPLSKKKSSNVLDQAWNKNVKCESMTEEEKKAQEAEWNRLREQGVQVDF